MAHHRPAVAAASLAVPAALAHTDSPAAVATAGHCVAHSQQRACQAPAVAVALSTAVDWSRQRCWNWPSSVYGLAVWHRIWARLRSDAPAALASAAVAVSGIDVD